MLSKRIQEARELKSMSKAELARRVSVSRASVSMWEDGKNISISNIIKIAEVLDVTPEWLQYGVENQTVKIEDLADCLEYTREISSRYDWELSDRQYARVAAYLYKERAKGLPVNDQQIASFLRQAS